MEFQFSKRAESFQPNIFNILNEKRQALIESGKKIYNMSVGTPDFPPAQHVLDVVSEAAKNPEEYKYSLGDTGELLSAVEGWYQNRYGVTLQDDEILSLAGSQEGFAHVALTLCDPGDVVLVPNPGYPVFEAGPFLNDAKIAYYELDKTNHYAPALDKIPEELAKKAKMMVVSYPLNPTCTCIESIILQLFMIMRIQRLNMTAERDFHSFPCRELKRSALNLIRCQRPII